MFWMLFGVITCNVIAFIFIFIKIYFDEKAHLYRMKHPEIYDYDY